MRGMNKVILIGNVGRAPELRTTPNGRTVANFSVATHRPVKQGDGWSTATDWHRVTAWERDAEVAGKYLTKGSPVAIEGELRQETWTDANQQKRSKVLVLTRKLHLLGSGVGSSTAPSDRSPERDHPAFTVTPEQNGASIPF